MEGVPTYPITPDLRLPCDPETADAILHDLEATFADLPRSHLDGVKIQFAEGWALARRSVTEPVITLRFEARSRETLDAIRSRVLGASADLQRLARQAGW
jgi:phosphomannomutase / phosphoglucomutase